MAPKAVLAGKAVHAPAASEGALLVISSIAACLRASICCVLWLLLRFPIIGGNYFSLGSLKLAVLPTSEISGTFKSTYWHLIRYLDRDMWSAGVLPGCARAAEEDCRRRGFPFSAGHGGVLRAAHGRHPIPTAAAIPAAWRRGAQRQHAVRLFTGGAGATGEGCDVYL